jgi:hypothetical protein
MKLYKDENLTDPVEQVCWLAPTLAGESQEFTFYIQNELAVELIDCVFSFDSSEITIKEYPKTLGPKEAKKLVISWNPSVDFKEGLKTKFTGIAYEVYKPSVK